MKVNVSAVKTFLYDQSDWYYAYFMKRVPRRPESALQLGTLWHVILEEFSTSGSRSAAKEKGHLEVEAAIRIMEADPLVPSTYVEEFVSDAEHLFNLFDAYRENFTFDETLLVEAPLEAPLLGGPHVLVGRPDRVVRYQGKFWHIQNRTLSDRTVMAVYLAAAERDLHELAYAYLITRHFNIDFSQYGGTLMNICRKVSKKKLAEDPNAAFVQEFIPIDPIQVARAIDDIATVADDMESIISGDRKVVENRDTDKGRHGNRLSPYYDVKRGRANILDNAIFKTAKSRYDSETV